MTLCATKSSIHYTAAQAMTILPDGRSERDVLDGEITAAKELRRLTDAYLAKVRDLYPKLSVATQRRITPAMQALRDSAATHRRA